MTTRNVLIALAVVVGAAVAAAFWYDAPEAAPTAPEAALISALTDELTTVEPGDPPVALSVEQATCVATGIVDDIGIDRLMELGVDAAGVRDGGFTPATVAFLDDERATVVSAFDACIDLLAVAVDSLAHARGQAARACVEEALAGPITRELWLWRVGPATAEAPAALEEALTTVDSCLG